MILFKNARDRQTENEPISSKAKRDVSE